MYLNGFLQLRVGFHASRVKPSGASNTRCSVTNCEGETFLHSSVFGDSTPMWDSDPLLHKHRILSKAWQQREHKVFRTLHVYIVNKAESVRANMTEWWGEGRSDFCSNNSTLTELMFESLNVLILWEFSDQQWEKAMDAEEAAGSTTDLFTTQLFTEFHKGLVSTKDYK